MSEKLTTRGASVSAVSTKDAFGAWLAHHQSSARMSLQKMAAEPLSSVMTCLVLGIALALPVSLFVVTENIKVLSGSWNDNPQISVFVRHNISPASTLALGSKLQQISGVVSVVYISPESGLEQFQQYAGFGEALKLLDENPLPAVYVIKPISADSGSLTLLSQQLKALPEIEYVQLDLAWIQKLQHILNLAERFIFLFGFLLCLGVVLTIANTIRLAIENRREEIIVVKLVGGTDAFVRRPLLYSGVCYGLAGAVVALMLVVFVTHLLTAPSLQLAMLYESPFSPHGLTTPHALLLLLAGAVLGLSGAWLAAARDLHKFNRLTH